MLYYYYYLSSSSSSSLGNKRGCTGAAEGRKQILYTVVLVHTTQSRAHTYTRESVGGAGRVYDEGEQSSAGNGRWPLLWRRSRNRRRRFFVCSRQSNKVRTHDASPLRFVFRAYTKLLFSGPRELYSRVSRRHGRRVINGTFVRFVGISILWLATVTFFYVTPPKTHFFNPPERSLPNYV